MHRVVQFAFAKCTRSSSWTFRSELPVLLDKTRFNIQQSTLSAKDPAQFSVLPENAQPCRLPDQPVQFIEDKMHMVYFAFGKLH